MTLTEIKKVIDEADVAIEKQNDGKENILLIEDEIDRFVLKFHLKTFLASGSLLNFYKFNDETREMAFLAKVDHIDKEKKIIKKKLDEMTKEEVRQLKDKLCVSRGSCRDCPFHNKFYCYGNFPFWKDRYEECKDKEFKIEVEE